MTSFKFILQQKPTCKSAALAKHTMSYEKLQLLNYECLCSVENMLIMGEDSSTLLSVLFLSSGAKFPERGNSNLQMQQIYMNVIQKNNVTNVGLPFLFFFVLTMKQSEMGKTPIRTQSSKFKAIHLTSVGFIGCSLDIGTFTS